MRWALDATETRGRVHLLLSALDDEARAETLWPRSPRLLCSAQRGLGPVGGTVCLGCLLGLGGLMSSPGCVRPGVYTRRESGMTSKMEKALVARLRARYRGRRAVGLDPATVERNLRLGKEKADAEGTSWPESAADLSPFAAALSKAKRKG